MAAYLSVFVPFYVLLADMETTFPSEMPTIPNQTGVETGIFSTIAVNSIVQMVDGWKALLALSRQVQVV